MAASFPSLSLNNNKWYFTREQIENSPSRRAGLDPDKELSYRQQAANLLQDMGQRLNVSQLTINTAIVYMHRFYMIQSFTRFHRNVIAPAALFLAAKVEEQPRKLEHVIKVTHACLNPQDPSPDTRSDTYLQQAQDLVILESIILQTLGKFGRARMVSAAGQTTKKSKVQDGDQSEAILNMISMASSDSTLAGLMSLSAPPSGSSMDSSADDHSIAPSSQHWQPPAKEQPTTNELHAPAKLSLNEYRVKHADELAAQKRKLENMEASVKQGYATAAQALMNQQKKEKHHHHQQSSSSSSDLNNPSPIVLKIPLDERTERSSIKMRLAVPGQSSSGGNSSSSSSRGSEPDIKVRIRVPERRSGSGEDGKSREKHRERSNHHHHHHHHSSSSTTGSLSASSSSSSAQKHSSSASASGSSKKVSGDSMRTSSSSSSSRKRTHLPDPSSGSHSSKVSKSSRNSFQLPTLPGVPSHAMGQGSDILPSLSLSHHQGNYSHSKLDKADTNGHNTGSQSNEYQDTFDMLNSLLSAQGVQPAQPQMFDYRSQYGEYRYSSSARGGTQAPPLPSEPPPPLPPLPK
ncbi:cyclin-T1-like [Sinocyclocheilus grahami]|uniref:cyclin-T1-like n=1 Tax=Sinocyclocheilus grahami TaxID=75366 RepID=UPI0007AD2FF8|nr:PREDICTED: cyclin-T1-like [Sinocyclocheilus grahami]